MLFDHQINALNEHVERPKDKYRVGIATLIRNIRYIKKFSSLGNVTFINQELPINTTPLTNEQKAAMSAWFKANFDHWWSSNVAPLLAEIELKADPKSLEKP